MSKIKPDHDIYYLDYSKIEQFDNMLHNKQGRKHFYKVDIPGNDTHVAFLPLRSKVLHPYGSRTIGLAGIDYHLAVIVAKKDIDDVVIGTALVSSKEYRIIQQKKETYQSGFERCCDKIGEATAKKELNIPLNPTENNLLNYNILIHHKELLGIDKSIDKHKIKLKEEPKININNRSDKSQNKFSMDSLKTKQQEINKEKKEKSISQSVDKKKTIS